VVWSLPRLLDASRQKPRHSLWDENTSWQQLAKYERAVDRISAGNLYAIASLLGVTVGYFVGGLGHDGGTTEPTSDLSWQEHASLTVRQQLNIGSLESAYLTIKSATARKGILDMTRMLAEEVIVFEDRRRGGWKDSFIKGDGAPERGKTRHHLAMVFRSAKMWQRGEGER
jgi:transcriptional regulator with XRE-family HTH domain